MRLTFEKEILECPGVTQKKMFGCPCYKAKDHLFLFLVIDGPVITKLCEHEIEYISKDFETTPFQAVTRTVKNCLRSDLGTKKK